jgi:hypothetical protein
VHLSTEKRLFLWKNRFCIGLFVRHDSNTDVLA